jgi:hypothetical protein
MEGATRRGGSFFPAKVGDHVDGRFWVAAEDRGIVRSSFLAHPGARFWQGKFRFWPNTKKEASEEARTPAATNAPSVSRCSVNDEMKSAVEMTPRGKPGKLEKRVSHSSHRPWKSGKKPRRQIPTFPSRQRRV